MNESILIEGIGSTRIGKLGKPADELLAVSISDALTDAGVDALNVDLYALACSNPSTLVQNRVDRPNSIHTNSAEAFFYALNELRSGRVETALIAGVETMSNWRTSPPPSGAWSDAEGNQMSGSTTPHMGYMAMYAKHARAYLDRYGAPEISFAEVAAKNSAHAALNPLAQFRQARTVLDVLASRAVVGNLRLYMCAPMSDGAAAILLSTKPLRRTHSARPSVSVRSSSLTSGAPGQFENSMEQRAAESAYEQASVEPRDLDLIELHDASAPSELIVSEKLQLCAPGDGYLLLRSGQSTLGGKIPINPGGGLVSRGHPIAASAALQIFEVVSQLRQRRGAAQVTGARLGLVESAGGYSESGLAQCVVTILEGNHPKG